MSRIGNAIIEIPKGVELNIGKVEMTVKGPKGELSVPIHPRLTVDQEDGHISVKRPSNNRLDRSQHGLTRSLINNAVVGVTEGFERKLEIHGVGYRCALKGQNLEFNLGFSHPVVIEPPQGISFEVPEQTRITVSGIDKQLVGQVCANIRKLRKPDSYHGKGVRYEGEYIRLKAGKAAGK